MMEIDFQDWSGEDKNKRIENVLLPKEGDNIKSCKRF